MSTGIVSEEKISTQMKRKAEAGKVMRRKPKFEGNTEVMISTGSTLLDLAISGGRVRGGGIPGGIFVEIFGPAGSGKTVLLCEIAGGVKRQGGEIMFMDPEARLNKTFARIFDLDVDKLEYSRPSTVPEVFAPVRKWVPKGKGINGIFADSLAALSTELELGKKGDKMGTRRAKEFSEELRKTCRTIAGKNYLMVSSNQLRQNVDAGQFGQKYKSPGGEAINFYSSLRLRLFKTEKIKKEKTFKGRDVTRVTGVETDIVVHKSSIWKPEGVASVIIDFDYGIDDIRANLQYVKRFSKSKVYTLNGEELDNSMEVAVKYVEENNFEDELREEVIGIWEAIENKFKVTRKPKKR